MLSIRPWGNANMAVGVAILLVWCTSTDTVHGQFQTSSGRVQQLSNQPAKGMFMNGVDPARMTNRVIDTSRIVTPQTGSLATSNSSFDWLTRIFRRAPMGYERKIAVSPLPRPESFQSTRYPNSFQPLRPVIPPPLPR